MTPVEFRETARAFGFFGEALLLLTELWAAAEKTRAERFDSVPGEGEAEMHSVLRRLGDL